MKRRFALILVCVIALTLLGSAHAELQSFGITPEAFAQDYNKRAGGSMRKLDESAAYTMQSGYVVYPLENMGDVSLLFPTGADGTMVGLGIVFTADCADFEQVVTILNRSLVLLATDTTSEERSGAIVDLIVGGVVTGLLENQNQTYTYLGAAEQYTLVYTVNAKQKQIMIMKGHQ